MRMYLVRLACWEGKKTEMENVCVGQGVGPVTREKEEGSISTIPMRVGHCRQ